MGGRILGVARATLVAFGAGRRPRMNEESGFTPDEWQTLLFAPFWVFSAVLGAYRDFDPLEYEAFAGALQDASSAPGRLTREVIKSVTVERDRLAVQYQTDARTIGRGLRAVAAI